jgi:type VII secretion protein EccE
MIRLAVVAGLFSVALLGWAADGYPGAAIGLVLGLTTLVAPWRGQPLWSWAVLYLRRNRSIALAEPVTVANDRCAGGVRYQDGVAVAAVQILGKGYRPTFLTGGQQTQTANVIDIAEFQPLLYQSMGLTIESLTIISSGSRRRSVGDYPRVYDTLIGTPPYAGRRETWMAVRIRGMDNGAALQCRDTVGTATLAAAQRIAAALRCKGIRARVATATDMVELERRLGRNSIEPHNRRWRGVRGDSGWYATYGYQPADLTSAALEQAWSWPADGIIQNVTMFPDGGATATVTVHTAQPATAPPNVMLQPLPGEQAAAMVTNMCCPRPALRGISTARLPQSVTIPVGSSGVLLGKVASGDRLLLPLSDPGENSRVRVAADDAIAKRIVVRTAGAGDRITVHTKDLRRWDSLRMPNVVVTDQPRPAPGTTVSVVDGTVQPAPRPSTVIAIGPPPTAADAVDDVVITQMAPAVIQVTAAGMTYEAEMEFFRAENRYAARSEPLAADLVSVV